MGWQKRNGDRVKKAQRKQRKQKPLRVFSCGDDIDNNKFSQNISNRVSRGSWVRIVAVSLLPFFLFGCITGDTGSRTVVGNHFALPKLSSAAGECELNIYESTEGAVVTTRKDCAVEIAYSNAYTNNILGIYEKTGAMTLSVKIEPTETENKENE